MIALIFLIITQIASFGIVRRVIPQLPLMLAVAFSMLIAVVSSTWLALGLIAVLGYPSGLAACMGIFTVLAIKLLPRKKTFSSIPISADFIFFISAWLLLFLLLFDRAFLKETAEGLQTVLYSYGDIALHSTYINYFAEQKTFSLQSPLFPQVSFSYPFLINFYTALLVKLGWSVRTALFISSLQVVTAGLTGLYCFAYNLTKKKITPFLASLLLLLNGGLGGAQFIKDWRLSEDSLSNFITHLPVDYAHIQELDYFWSNIVTTHLLPQRGFLVGFSALLVFLASWQWIWNQKKVVHSAVLLLSVFTGLLPLFHTHSFLVICPLQVWLVGWFWHKKKLSLQRSLLLLAPAVLIGGTQILFLSAGKSFISWQVGWMAAEGKFWTFWWKNMGLYLAWLLVAPFLFWRYFVKKKFEQLLVIPALAIVILANIYIFQPNAWDNMKFFMLSHTILSVIFASVFTHFWKNFLSRSIIIVILIITCWSGALSILYIYQNPVAIASNDDLTLAQFIKKTPSDSLFLTADAHNHVVAMLGGRATILGYRGWLWTHAVDYSKEEQDVAAMYQGIGTQQLITTYNIDYIFVGPHEKRQFTVDEVFFENNYQIFYKDELNTVYQVSTK